MKQTHFPYHIKGVNAGANTQSDEEVLGSGEAGEYYDARNSRTGNMTGNMDASVKIKGEEIKFSDIDNSCTAVYGGGALPDGWECMLAEEINQNIVEVWANANSVIPPFVRINGVIVASHPDLPFNLDYPLQWDKDESCVGGELFTTDHNTPPIILNIKDMMLNNGMDVGDEQGACTEKYYDDFLIGRYTVNLDTSMDSFRFIQLTSAPFTIGANLVLGTGGLPCGQYQYQFRFVDADGNRSSFSPPSVMIPVIQQFSSQSDQYPYSKTFGGDINEDTGYGIHLRVRINNPLNYDFIEIKRIPYNNGEGLTFTPNGEIIGVYQIANGEVSVLNIIDYGAEPEEEILVEDDVQRLSAIASAKAIRYFGRRLNLMNIRYASRDLEGQVTYKQRNGVEMFPIQQYLGKGGHADPYHTAHNKSYQHNEFYGFGTIWYDGQGNYSFVDEVVNFDNYQFPHRREPIAAGNSDDFSSAQRPMVKDYFSNLPATGTWEIFDMHDPIKKTDACSFINIIGCLAELDPTGRKLCTPFFILPIILTPSLWCTDPYPPNGVNENPASFGCADVSCFFGAPPPFFLAPAYAAPYKVFHPTSYTDPDVSGHDYIPNVRVGIKCRLGTWLQDEFEDYNPKGFSPDWYTMGIALAGIETYPSWAKGFSVVRTRAAGRIVAQGIGMYKINNALNPNQTDNDSSTKATKEQRKLWFYASDMENAIGVDPSEIALMQATPQNYKIQLISPQGFFSEVYHGRFDDTQVDHTLDIIAYGRVQFDDGSINQGDSTGNIGDNGRVQFGQWRNLDAAVPAWANKLGTIGRAADAGGNLHTFNLTGISAVTDGDRLSPKFELTVDEDIYFTTNIGSDDCHKRFDKIEMRNWHEPFYTVNIIRNDVQQPSGQTIKEFVGTGHYQKLESVIGVGNGNNNRDFILVDERWEDCCPALDPTSPFAGDYSYIYIVDEFETETKWLNTTYLPALQALIDASLALGNPYDLGGGNLIYGTYTHFSTGGIDGERFTTIRFNNPNSIVPSKAQIIVKYDNRLPIKIFGGDVINGEDIFAPIDRDSTCECSAGVAKTEEFRLNLGFPYHDFQINNRYYVPSNQTMAIVQQCNAFDTNYIRQMAIMYPAQSRTHTWYCFEERVTEEFVPSGLNGYFPATHYIIRPCKFSCDDPDLDYCDGDFWISTDYRDDYPNSENLVWGYGGFRYNKMPNADYSRDANHVKYITKPIVGFEEETEFCTRHIWTPERNISAQDEPNLRTFPELNAYDCDDAQGEIKTAYSALSEKGHNLYAICDSGVVLLLTNKKILSDINANELAVMGSGDNQFVQTEYWLSRVIGMNDETWRSKAEWNNVLNWVNFNSAYTLIGNEIVDIGRKNYYPSVRSRIIDNLGVEYSMKLAGCYDTLHNEYWVDLHQKQPCYNGEIVQSHSTTLLTDYTGVLDNYDLTFILTGTVEDGDLRLPSITAPFGSYQSICVVNETELDVIVSAPPIGLSEPQFTLLAGETACWVFDWEFFSWRLLDEEPLIVCDKNTLVYNPLKEHWNGRYDYTFDKYLSFEGNTYGFRNGLTYELNKGWVINGEEIEFELEQVFAPAGIDDGEFKRLRVGSDQKPTLVEFRGSTENPVEATIDTVTNALGLKDYNAWEQYVPRKSAAPFNRFQGRRIAVRVKHKGEEFKMKMIGVQFAPMK